MPFRRYRQLLSGSLQSIHQVPQLQLDIRAESLSSLPGKGKGAIRPAPQQSKRSGVSLLSPGHTESDDRNRSLGQQGAGLRFRTGTRSDGDVPGEGIPYGKLRYPLCRQSRGTEGEIRLPGVQRDRGALLAAPQRVGTVSAADRTGRHCCREDGTHARFP